MFGDKELYFRHQIIEDDLALMPEWTDYEPPFKSSSAIEEGEEQPKARCPFAYLWEDQE